MILAVASGKGGTGKTTVATNLAAVASQQGWSVSYLDCDVEAPNGALFLNPAIKETRPVSLGVPKVDMNLCTGCGLCGEICQYSAIVVMKGEPLVFPELCHACSGCWLVCPEAAITESPREIGYLRIGQAAEVQFAHGLLNIGETKSPPLIRRVKNLGEAEDLRVIDSPPGTSCPVIESARGADFVLLVTEPTPFGLNDLKLAVEMVRELELSFGVVLNRSDLGESPTRSYCRTQRIEVLCEIPDDRRVAEAYSRGELICEALPEYGRIFTELLMKIGTRREVSRKAEKREARL